MLDTTHMVFVAATNLDGAHGQGSALYARNHHGLELGISEGPCGNTYAIPTVGHRVGYRLARRTLEEVKGAIDRFIVYANYTYQPFQVTRIGCQRAGFTDAQIAPLFKDAPANCYFDEVWKPWLPEAKFWGTYNGT